MKFTSNAKSPVGQSGGTINTNRLLFQLDRDGFRQRVLQSLDESRDVVRGCAWARGSFFRVVKHNES